MFLDQNSLSTEAYLKELFSQAKEEDGAICLSNFHHGHFMQQFLSISDICRQSPQLSYVLHSLEREDAFFSFATYKGGRKVKRDTAHLANIYAWSIDVDYQNGSIRPEDMFSYIMDSVSLPQPSFVEMGHRLRLIYVLKEPLRLYGKQKAALLRAFHFLQECMAGMINEELSFGEVSFGAESCPPTSFFRIPGSINSKDSSRIRVYAYSQERYTFQEVFEEFVPSRMLDASGCREEWYASWKRKKKKKKTLQPYSGTEALWKRRLEILRELRTYPGAHRKKLCFVYACGLVHAHIASSAEEVITLTEEYNEGFPCPLPLNKVHAHTKLVFKKPYRFSDRYLTEYLEVPDGVFSGQSRKERDHERYLRRKKCTLSVSDKIHTRRQRLKELLLQGHTQSDAARILSVSLSTIKRDAYALKEELAITIQEKMEPLKEKGTTLLPLSFSHAPVRGLAERKQRLMRACSPKTGSSARPQPGSLSKRLKSFFSEENQPLLPDWDKNLPVCTQNHIYIQVNKNDTMHGPKSPPLRLRPG